MLAVVLYSMLVSFKKGSTVYNVCCYLQIIGILHACILCKCVYVLVTSADILAISVPSPRVALVSLAPQTKLHAPSN